MNNEPNTVTPEQLRKGGINCLIIILVGLFFYYLSGCPKPNEPPPMENEMSIDYSDSVNPKIVFTTGNYVTKAWNDSIVRLLDSLKLIIEEEKNRIAEIKVVEKKQEIQPENTRPKNIPYYQILRELQIRYDGGMSYYVLINPVNLNNDKFIEDIKLIIDDISWKKGRGINIDILDNRQAFDLMYRSHYGNNSLGRALRRSEMNILARHLIASYASDLASAVNPNSLLIFPSAYDDTPIVGKYIQEIVYYAK